MRIWLGFVVGLGIAVDATAAAAQMDAGVRDAAASNDDGAVATVSLDASVDARSFDAVVVPGGDTTALTDEPRAVDFVGHACGLDKPVAAIGNGRSVVEASGSAGVGLVRGDDVQVMRVARELIMALAAGPHWSRQQHTNLSA
jgi:putative intracellular protease/amidase